MRDGFKVIRIGILSDTLGKELPNSSGFSLTNEQYLSTEVISYERIGTPPDIEVRGV